MKQKKLKERGITLIALVITIILLLILAGVTLKIVLDEGFVDKTQKAVDKYSEAQKNETEQIKYFLENYLGEVDNTEGKEHRTLNGADPAYNNPIIPVGFKTSNGGASWSSIDGKTVQGWNDGLVIEDKEGNQFVWVPVDRVNVKYEKWCTIGTAYNNSNITGDESPNGIDETNQITKYGGFYIGRYEAGISESMIDAINPIAEGEEVTSEKIIAKRNVIGTPVVKKNQVPWNFIDYNNSKANAESMYTGSSVKSGLLTGTMWDTVMLWLKNSGVNVETDCREWGNYRNSAVTGITQYSPYRNDAVVGVNWTSVSSRTKPAGNTADADNCWLLKTGHSEYTKRKNIYDLAGNEWEWTSEIYDSARVIRGGCYVNDNTGYTAAARAFLNVASTENYRVFRVCLYIQ